MQLFLNVWHWLKHISKFVSHYSKAFQINKFKLKRGSLDCAGQGEKGGNLLKAYEEILNLPLDIDF